MKIRPADDLSKALPVAETIAALRERAEKAEKERDARPTEWSYEQACKAIEKHRNRAEAAGADLKALREHAAPGKRTNHTDNYACEDCAFVSETADAANAHHASTGHAVYEPEAAPGPVDVTRTGRDPHREMHHYHMPDGHCTCKPERRTGKDRRAAPSTEELREASDRLANVICESGPLFWAHSGDQQSAQDWEIKAKLAVENYRAVCAALEAKER